MPVFVFVSLSVFAVTKNISHQSAPPVFFRSTLHSQAMPTHASQTPTHLFKALLIIHCQIACNPPTQNLFLWPADPLFPLTTSATLERLPAPVVVSYFSHNDN